MIHDTQHRVQTRRTVLASALGLMAGGVSMGLLTRDAQAPVAPAVPPKNTPAPAARLQDWPSLDALAQEMIEARVVPGLSLSVMREGVSLYAKGFGLSDVQTQTPVLADTPFRIASITKQFTAAAILKLAEGGHLTLDDPLAAHLSYFPRAEEISLRQLLSHTAGLGDYINGQADSILSAARERDYTATQVLALIAARQPLFRAEPGTRFLYSNSGYTLLSTVVEQCSGMAFADYCQQNLFTPAGMINTAIDASCDDQSGCSGYILSGNGFEAVRPLSPSFLRGAGAMRSTSEDLVRWHTALMDGKILKSQSLEAMLTPASLKNGEPVGRSNRADAVHYGLGQNLGELAAGEASAYHVFSHGGNIRGFTGHLRSVREPRVTVAVLYNSDGGGTGRYGSLARAIRTEGTRLGLLDAGIKV